MFYQNVLIVYQDKQHYDDFLLNQLRGIGYRPDQLMIAYSGQRNHEITYEVILFDVQDDFPSPSLLRDLNTNFPEIPIILIATSIPADYSQPKGVDDWLLKSWIVPVLLKKTIKQAIARKINDYNYMHIFSENPSPMYIYEKKTYRFMEANLATLRQYGYSKDELLKMTAKEIRPMAELKDFYKINEELPPKYSNAGIWQHQRKNGEIFYVHVFTHQILFSGKSCALVLAIDIDRNIKIETALREKIKETENILESITDGFFTVNKNWEFTYINKEFERIIGLSRDQLLGKNLWEAFPQTASTAFFIQHHKAMNEKVSVHFEEYYPELSCWLTVNTYPTQAGLAIYFIDSTAQKDYQQKIEKQNKQFKEIAWVQAHQIRGPVSNLLGLVDLFNVNQLGDPDNLELLARVRHTALQMDESIKDIVYLTRKLES